MAKEIGLIIEFDDVEYTPKPLLRLTNMKQLKTNLSPTR